MPDRPITVGELLLTLRTQAQLSQFELARRSGVNRSTLARIEANKTEFPDLDTLERLARALAVDVEAFFDLVWSSDGAPLPSPATYFREKFGLTDAQISELVATAERMARRRRWPYRHRPRHTP